MLKSYSILCDIFLSGLELYFISVRPWISRIPTGDIFHKNDQANDQILPTQINP